MIKLLCFVLISFWLYADPFVGFVLLFIGYILLMLEGLPKRENKYKKRFEQITKKTTYIVEDYGTDTTTRKSCE